MAEYGVTACLTKPVTSIEIISTYLDLGAPKRIAMVDDDRGFCHLIGQVLGNYDPSIQFESAYGVDQGMRVVEDMDPDFVIVDLALGGEDGRDFLERLRSKKAIRLVPILLLTATDAPSSSSDFRSPTITVSREPGFTVAETMQILSAITNCT
jgi:CheY-like chemotaxis protein